MYVLVMDRHKQVFVAITYKNYVSRVTANSYLVSKTDSPLNKSKTQSRKTFRRLKIFRDIHLSYEHKEPWVFY